MTAFVPTPPRTRRHLRMLSASKLDLAAACLYPFTSGIDWPDDDDSDASIFGRAVHVTSEWLAAAPLDAPRQADEIALGVELVAEHFSLRGAAAERLVDRVDIVATHLDEETVDRREGEARIAYDPQSGQARRLAEGEERRGGEMVLVIDMLLEAGGAFTVRDWKTGRRPIIRSVEDSRQIWAYALAAHKIWNLDAVTVELCWLSDRGVWTDRSRFDAFDFDVIEHRLRELDSDRRRGGHNPRLGLHCHELFCPIKALCPAALAAAEAVYHETRLRHPLVTEEAAIRDHEHARELLERIPLAMATLEQAQKALEGFVSHNGAIDLGDGKAWGRVEHPGNWEISATDEARAVLNEALGEHAELAIKTVTKTSQSAINTAIRKATAGEKRGAQAKLRAPIHKRLKELGAMRRGAPYTRFEAFKRKA